MLSTFALDSAVLQEGICTGCGACQGLCPYWDSMRGRTVTYFDCVREEGRCQRFCPRMPTDLQKLRQEAFPGETILSEIGPFRDLLLARAADPKIREQAQHGGVVTALMELALQEGLLDAAVLTHAIHTLNPEGELVTTAEGVRRCSGDSYQIPPTLAVLNRALRENKYHRIGIVGTPCKTLAVYKMKLDQLPKEDTHTENIGLVIGLFCGWGLDWDGIEALTSKYANGQKVGHMDIPPSKYHAMEITAGGKVTSVNLDEVNPLVRNACHYCSDMTAEFADLSVGGARSADGWDVDKKWNQIIVRTAKGQELVDLARRKKVLEFKVIPSTGLEKLKKASNGKKRTAVRYLHEKYGKDSLGYLEPCKELFKKI